MATTVEERQRFERENGPLIRGITRAIKQGFAAELEERDERIGELETRLEAIEHRAPNVRVLQDSSDPRRILINSNGDVHEIFIPALMHKGVWTPETRYVKGDTCSRSGSLWVALRDGPTSTPGKDSGADWRLIVKKGQVSE